MRMYVFNGRCLKVAGTNADYCCQFRGSRCESAVAQLGIHVCEAIFAAISNWDSPYICAYIHGF
jgi:hypothetical protein